ncbi:MAG: TRAP transporter small permease subunit [Rhodoferax sp.]|nr:TRAP transporter small permease subunit [Rhodoferax sp.]
MSIQKLTHTAEAVSTWVGKAFAWLIVALMLLVVVEVFKRYVLNAPTAWVFDASNMLYGTLFMMGGAYALAHDGHVRGDFFYGSMAPRKQAAIDMVLYIAFFLPGIAALTWSGWTYFQESLAIREQTFNADPLPLYPFKFMIPLAGALVLMQGISEIMRCVVCLKTGEWLPRIKDAEEADVVAQQLASSEFVDDEARKLAIESAKGLKS